MRNVVSNSMLIVVVFLATILHTTAMAQFEQNFVTVGDINNPTDSFSGCGKVEQSFQISKFEVTNTEYSQFLNAVSSQKDEFELYTPLMSEHFWGGIEQIKVNGIFHYQVKKGYEKKPVTFVSYYDTLRYINWLHYGKPSKSVANSTEGTSIFGAYDTSKIEKTTKIIKRNKEAQYFLPNCNEWTKAAFYSNKSGYMKFATNTNNLNKETNSINFFRKSGWSFQYPHLVDVDFLVKFPSPYGTLNQQGNVAEWVEEGIGSTSALVLGGSLFMNKGSLSRNYKDGELPDHKLSTFGFRVARKMQVKVGKLPAKIQRSFHQKSERKLAPVSEYSLIDHEGNLNDPVNGYGAVAYKFYMSKYSLTNKSYAQFLNDVARLNDKYALYNEHMASGVLGGIEKEIDGGFFHYKVKLGHENLPVTYVSWFDIARYVNYLHFDKPNIGEAILGTTEGNEILGAYDTRVFPSSTFYDASSLPETRNKGAKYWIPTSNEWYKSAYFDPDRFGNRKYWDYPNRSSLPPKINKNDSLSNYQGSHLAVGPPLYLAPVTSYSGTTGYFDLKGMGGNVWEWLEDWRNRGDGTCWRCNEWVKGLRGGSFGYTYRGLHSSNLDPGDPRDEYYIYGARIAKAYDIQGFNEKEVSIKDMAVSIQKEMSKRYVLLLGLVLGTFITLLMLLTVKRLSFQ